MNIETMGISWDEIGNISIFVFLGIFFGTSAVVLWRLVLITAFRESRRQGLLCIFPLYAIYYGIKTEWFDVKSVIKKFMKAGAARNVKAAYACWSPQSVTEEEIADFIRGRYDIFAGYNRMYIDHREGYLSGDMESCYVSGDVTYTGGKKLPLGVQLMKENKVWKISGIRIGSTEKGTVTSVSRPIDAGPVDTGS